MDPEMLVGTEKLNADFPFVKIISTECWNARTMAEFENFVWYSVPYSDAIGLILYGSSTPCFCAALEEFDLYSPFASGHQLCKSIPPEI